jgi:hypothetical protein
MKSVYLVCSSHPAKEVQHVTTLLNATYNPLVKLCRAERLYGSLLGKTFHITSCGSAACSDVGSRVVATRHEAVNLCQFFQVGRDTGVWVLVAWAGSTAFVQPTDIGQCMNIICQ